MSWFTKPAKPVESAPELTPLDELREMDAAYQQAERAFDYASADCLRYARTHFDPRIVVIPGRGILSKINGWQMDIDRRRLEATRQRAWAKRNDLLSRRAELRREMGL